ncbi:hypothetical protein MKX03_001096, partial [Papaver bracteatum]
AKITHLGKDQNIGLADLCRVLNLLQSGKSGKRYLDTQTFHGEPKTSSRCPIFSDKRHDTT